MGAPSTAENHAPCRSTPWGVGGTGIRSSSRLEIRAVPKLMIQPGTASLLAKRSSRATGYFLSRWTHHAPIPTPAANAAQAFFFICVRPFLDISSAL